MCLPGIGDADYRPAGTFCHTFDLGKRLKTSDMRGTLSFYPLNQVVGTGQNNIPDPSGRRPPFIDFIYELARKMETSSSDAVHRVILPGFLSPTLYGMHVYQVDDILQFMHGLRALLRRYGAQLSAIIVFPTSLYPRSLGFTRWMELLSDCVLELSLMTTTSQESAGILSTHTLPVHNERGRNSQVVSSFSTQSFKLSRSSGLVIEALSLPPCLGDNSRLSDNPSSKSTTLTPVQIAKDRLQF